MIKENMTDPLAVLLKLSEEIQEMIAKGELMPRGPYYQRKKRVQTSYLGLYAIQAGRILVNERFTTFNSAKAWGLWNYKGREIGWQVVKLHPVPCIG